MRHLRVPSGFLGSLVAECCTFQLRKLDGARSQIRWFGLNALMVAGMLGVVRRVVPGVSVSREKGLEVSEFLVDRRFARV